MFKPRSTFKDIILGLKNVSTDVNNSIKLDKVLILSKLSRYEFEKTKFNLVKEQDFEKKLRGRGTDFEKLVRSHDLHKKFEESVAKTFGGLGLNVEVVNRFNYTEEKAHWADVVVPIGGDGTFLLAASKIRNNQKPVIGLNSDPRRSEGHLCLPKIYSTDLRKAVDKLQKGQFDWLMRNRIRIKLICHDGVIIPKSLHELEVDCVPVTETDPDSNSRILPVLALNEVFVGETTSSRVSFLQMRLNGSIEQTSIKCSGVCVCTGTGSTSWHLSINRIPAQSVAELLTLVRAGIQDREMLASQVAEVYNKNLVFKPDDMNMCYTVRDLISAGVWPQPKGIKPRDFVTKMELKSNCFDASLVIDGGFSFDFNDGTVALLEIKPEDSLRTILLRE